MACAWGEIDRATEWFARAPMLGSGAVQLLGSRGRGSAAGRLGRPAGCYGGHGLAFIWGHSTVHDGTVNGAGLG